MAAKRADVLAKLSIGQVVEGKVTRLAKFGAFVDLGGIDGLIHISQMSYKRINDPSEVLKEGQEVEVEVLKVDEKEGRISLKLQNFNDNPWLKINEKIQEGQIIEGTVKRVTDFGAFVEIGDGIEGLVHISQISEDHINSVSEVVEVGQKVTVKVLEIKKDQERIGLSMKDTEEEIAFEMEADEEELTLGDIFKDKFANLDLK